MSATRYGGGCGSGLGGSGGFRHGISSGPEGWTCGSRRAESGQPSVDGRHGCPPGRGRQALPFWSARSASSIRAPVRRRCKARPWRSRHRSRSAAGRGGPSGLSQPCGTVPRVTQTDAVPDRILTVTAHPDDVDFGAAGSVAAWTAAGAARDLLRGDRRRRRRVRPVVPRTRDPGHPPGRADVPRPPRWASRTSIWLGYPDGRVEASLSTCAATWPG